MHQKKALIFASAVLLVFLSACITQQEQLPVTDNTPEPSAPLPQPENPTTPPNNQPIIDIPTLPISGEFTLKTGESVKNIRGLGIYSGTLIELRVKSVVYRHFPASKIAVFEALNESGTVLTQKDVRAGRYLNEDMVAEDSYDPILQDKIYIKDVIVSEEGNSVTIEINK